MFGLNVRSDGYHSADWIRATGATAARVVLTPEHDLGRWAVLCKDRGIELLWVYARESGAGFSSALEALRFYDTRYSGLLEYVQPGNEPDLASPSSWTMMPNELTNLGWTARYVLPTSKLICAGLASGQPSWLADVDLRWCDAIAAHPYLKDAPNPDDAEDIPDVDVLIADYRAYGLPVWITEWGWWGDDEERGGQETSEIMTWVRDSGAVERYFHFCADDGMVPPFGLYRDDGSIKPAGQAFLDVATSTAPPDAVWIGDGLQRELDRRGWTPTTGEYQVPNVHAITRTGQDRLLVWDEDGASAWKRVG